MAEEFPFLVWQIIFDELNFETLMTMRKTPVFRDLLFRYFSSDYNRQQLERNIILECIEDKLGRDIKLELVSFFVQYGYKSQSTPEKSVEMRKLVGSYLDDVIQIFKENKDGSFSQSYIDAQIEKIKEMKKENSIPYELLSRFKNANPYKFYDLREVSNVYKEKIDELIEKLDREDVESFSMKLFQAKNGYERTMEYLNEVKNYVAKNYSREWVSELEKCIDTRLNTIRKLFG